MNQILRRICISIIIGAISILLVFYKVDFQQESKVITNQEFVYTIPVRYFEEITTDSLKGARHALSCLFCRGAFSKMYEVDKDGNVLSDTMLVWTQHFEEGGVIYYNQALKADMIITCFPNKIGVKELTNKHIFPNHDNLVVLNFDFKGGVEVFAAPDSIFFENELWKTDQYKVYLNEFN